MKKHALIFFACLLSFSGIFAQQVRPLNSSEIYQRLKQLNNLTAVMYFAAHPDDENTRLISYLVHHDNVRTVYYSLTRGDGGQNIIGNEQGPALGLIRTYELLQARKLDGAEQMFSPFVDFGFTNSVDETFHFWNKEKLVQDAVKAIQDVQPDVIICRFPTTGEGGHGHHTASAIIAREAWNFIYQHNLSDANNQLWLPKRLLFNAFQFGDRSTIKPGQFKMKINNYDPLLGEGLGELAGKSRSEHKSQGAGTPQIIGITNEHFELIAGDKIVESLYDGFPTSWGRIGYPKIEESVQKVIDKFSFTNPSLSIPELLKIKKEIQKVEDKHWRIQKLKEIDQIILSCAGVMSEALLANATITPGQKATVQLNLIARGKYPVELSGVTSTKNIVGNMPNGVYLNDDSLYFFPFQIQLSEDEPITQPYWMATEAVNNEYQFDSKYLGMAIVPNDLSLMLHLRIDDVDFSLPIPLSYKKLDPVRGDVTQRLRIVPLVSVEPINNLLVFEADNKVTASLKIKTFAPIPKSDLIINAGKYSKKIKLPFMAVNTDTFIAVSLSGKDLANNLDAKNVSFSIEVNGQKFDKTQHLIDYTHIPEVQYFTPAVMKLVPKDWKVTAQKIGYVEGVGDYVDDVLKLTGLQVEQIPELELNNQEYLKQFDAIVIGIRAFNTHKSMIAGIDGLLKYVRDGGSLVVQYNTSTNLMTNRLGPYQMRLSKLRVTDEEAPVKFVHPNSPLLNTPNKITEKDFENWVQERGLYFADDWDKKNYQALLATQDKGGLPLAGSTLYAQYGKGHYVYTSLAFFRQLPAGNVGAIRLFMNFLSAGSN